MTMNAHTIGWFVFLALITNCSHAQPPLFTLVDSHLMAKEGSCTEIKCKVTSYVDDFEASWFWMKDALWSEKNHYYFNATVIYSTNQSSHPVSPDFATRVTYNGTSSSRWKYFASSELCSVLICDLKTTDSGNYLFRFLGKDKWATKPGVNLTVKENPCPITFEKPPAVKESDTITLTCSTLSSCTSNPQIKDLTKLPPTRRRLMPQRMDEKLKSTAVSFTANWEDDGKEFSCQTQDNEDPHLIRKINVIVEYAPIETLAEISPSSVKEGQTVALTCSAKGNPEPTFNWFKNEERILSEAQWNITSIADSQSGNYSCETRNKHGTSKSQLVVIDVLYEPEVEVKITSSSNEFKQGAKMTLICNVKRSNPQPHSYGWLKNEKMIGGHTNQYDKRIEPDDSGSYACTATNTVDTRTSNPLQIFVLYRPRKTRISISEKNKVKVGNPLTLSCDTDANPAPMTYSWYRYNNDKQIDSSQWKWKTTTKNTLRLMHVQRTDDACYMCNATNIINTGENSEQECIQVLYPPTNLTLLMDTEATEGQLVTISCTVESFPWSHLKLMRTSTSNPRSHNWLHSFQDQQPNTLQHTFNVTSTHTGFYTCVATNSEGSNEEGRNFVVKYRPKDVTVQAQPGFIVTENASLTLHCSAQSYPGVTSFTWMKTTDGKIETIQKTQTIEINSVSLSDGGIYNCSASNEIGTGNSQQAEVKVKHAPKHTNIMRAAEQQHPDGTSSVTLICSSHSYPPVSYSWYKKTEDKERGIKVSSQRNYTVYSDKPGIYYCIAKNEINQRLSDPVELFVDRGFLKLVFLFLIILLVVVILFFVYRHKRNKSIQGNANTPRHFGFQSGGNCARRRMNEPIIAEPSRSRDDLLPDQPCQRRQLRPDSTPASNINSVYCTVNQPAAKQGPSAQNPIGQQGGHTEGESLNYASLHFGHEQKNEKPKAGENIVYAMVSKPKLPKENKVYENVGAAYAARNPNPWNYDTDTSEDEAQLNYSQVSFKAKAGHQKAGRDSSTSDEEETQYSEVKI